MYISMERTASHANVHVIKTGELSTLSVTDDSSWGDCVGNVRFTKSCTKLDFLITSNRGIEKPSVVSESTGISLSPVYHS